MRLFDRFRSEPVYNTRAVVQRTGVPADTFRAWERRYGLPAPRRTAGNQRLYSERDVAVIGWLRDQTKAGLTISQAVVLYRVEESEPAPPDVAGSVRPDRAGGNRVAALGGAGRLAEFRNRFVEALIGFDDERADQVVEEAVALLAVDDVCLHVLEKALVDVGERWQRGEIGVGAEHFASSYIMRKLAVLFNLSQPQRGRGPIVAACVEGELHEIGLLSSCLFLSRHGFKIIYLGANLPLFDLLAVVQTVKPPLVLLSAATATHLEKLVETIGALAKSAFGAGASAPAVGYGGRMFVAHPDLCERIEATYLGDDAGAMVAKVERILARAESLI